MTMQEFVEANGIGATVRRVQRNPLMPDMPRNFAVTLRRADKKMRVVFSQGAAWTTEPTAADVLDCCAADAAGIDNARTFEEWCAEYGYDTDSRSAERTYNATRKQAAALLDFMGADYDTLLYSVERM